MPLARFFSGDFRHRINWSKIPFEQLPTTGQARRSRFDQIKTEMGEFARRVRALGYTAATLDDVVHLTDHDAYEEHVRKRIRCFSEEFRDLVDILKGQGLEVYVTMDVLSTTPALRDYLEETNTNPNDYLKDLLSRFLDEWPDVAGVIVRVGESDGQDVNSDFTSRLHLKTPESLNAFLKHLLPVFETRERRLILRTWTVGAYRIGDLIWHRDTLTRSLAGC